MVRPSVTQLLSNTSDECRVTRHETRAKRHDKSRQTCTEQSHRQTCTAATAAPPQADASRPPAPGAKCEPQSGPHGTRINRIGSEFESNRPKKTRRRRRGVSKRRRHVEWRFTDARPTVGCDPARVIARTQNQNMIYATSQELHLDSCSMSPLVPQSHCPSFSIALYASRHFEGADPADPSCK